MNLFLDRNTTVEQYFSFVEDSNANLYFYLNNFQSLQSSYVTLFELTGKNGAAQKAAKTVILLSIILLLYFLSCQ